MAGKIIKKSQGNFEKMKREMVEKKNLAELQQISAPLQVDVEDEICNTQKQGNELVKEQHTLKLIVFRIAEEEFAIRISNVKEIIRVPAMTNVPSSSPYIKGLCNLRGMLLPVIDCRKLFGMVERDYAESSRIIVTDIQGQKVGLLSDKVIEVLNIEEEHIQSPPSGLKRISGDVINGILMLDKEKRVVLILDSEKIIKVCSLEAPTKEQLAETADCKSSENYEHDNEQIVVFNMGKDEFGFNINHVREIIRVPDIIKVPQAPRYIEGILSVRNQFLAIVNLRELLGMDYKKHNGDSRIFIIDNGFSTFGVVVDNVSSVIGVQKKLFKERSELASHIIKGIFNLDDGKRHIMILDPGRLMSLEQVKRVIDNHSLKSTSGKIDFSSSEEDDSVHIVIFKIGNQEYALEINQVQEIRNLNELTKFPGAPNFITGMINLRGSIVPILNIRNFVLEQVSSADNDAKYLVVDFKGEKIGIIIDSASDVVRCSKNYLEKISDALDSSERYIDKIAKLNKGKRIVLMLNLQAILNFM